MVCPFKPTHGGEERDAAERKCADHSLLSIPDGEQGQGGCAFGEPSRCKLRPSSGCCRMLGKRLVQVAGRLAPKSEVECESVAVFKLRRDEVHSKVR